MFSLAFRQSQKECIKCINVRVYVRGVDIGKGIGMGMGMNVWGFHVQVWVQIIP